MCYNKTQSFLFFLIGLILTVYIYLREPALAKTKIHYIVFFYCIMELLQFVQYFYVNQCENKINKLLTEVAYVLVIVQPLMWNLFFYNNSDKYEKYIFLTAIYLCLFWILMNVASRLLYHKTSLPRLKNSTFSGDKVCTKQLNSHVYWNWPSADLFDFNPNYLSYLMIWFIPALISKSSFYYALLLIAGALLSAVYAQNYHSREELFLTFGTAWCFVSIPCIILILVYMVYSKYKRKYRFTT